MVLWRRGAEKKGLEWLGNGVFIEKGNQKGGRAPGRHKGSRIDNRQANKVELLPTEKMRGV